jgi:hypothetical protein
MAIPTPGMQVPDVENVVIAARVGAAEAGQVATLAVPDAGPGGRHVSREDALAAEGFEGRQGDAGIIADGAEGRGPGGGSASWREEQGAHLGRGKMTLRNKVVSGVNNSKLCFSAASV